MSAAPAVDRDEKLEQLIRCEAMKALHSRNAAHRHAAARRMRELIAQRSPQQVARMERERGLHR